MTRRKIIIYSAVIIVFSSGFICYGILNMEKGNRSINEGISDLSEQVIIDNTLIVSSSDEERVLPTAELQIKQYYKKCGHTTVNEFSVPEDIVNMDKNQLQKYYFGWNIDYFSSKSISISRVCDGICDEHYIVKDVDGLVNVYNFDDKNNEELVYSTKINTKYLPKEDWEKLQIGIEIVGKENLSLLLEDYE